MVDIEGSIIVITGGAGFIGSSLARRLVEKNQVVIYDNLSRNAIQYSEISKHQNVEIVKGDILDKAHFEEVCKKFRPEYIVHCAAIAGIDTVIKIAPSSNLATISMYFQIFSSESFLNKNR